MAEFMSVVYRDMHKLPEAYRASLCKQRAEEFIAYIEKREIRRPLWKTRLRDLCIRFKMKQADVILVIDSTPRLSLSHFMYVQTEEDDDWGEAMTKAWFPRYVEDAPLSQRIVHVFSEDEVAEMEAEDEMYRLSRDLDRRA